MPKKIRELKAILRRAAFVMKPGKGSHTNWYHPRYPGRVTISGKDGEDAREYQEDLVAKAIKIVEGGE
jgi:predicted RNA binding protein YcfA (HicA-like mRNA interferase family)